MNYINLLARGLLILYCVFLLFFGFGENAGTEGFIHIVQAIVILLLLFVLKGKPVLSFIVFIAAFVLSVWFFNSYSDIVLFSIISLPLAIASVLFLIGKYYPSAEKKVNQQISH